MVAGQLWPSGTHERSAASLRTTLWRLPEDCAHLVERRDSSLVLSDRLHVDVDDVEACASDVIASPGDGRAARALMADAPLLPGWSDCWVVLERERLHLLRLGALEVAATACLDAHDPTRALEFALAAIRAEPLRESTWRLAISAHRDLGNLADVCRAYADYRELMHSDLGLPPSPLMRALVCEIGADLQVENILAR
ncbi:AfsR/SARP family transcriptional regulator [Terrabacter sp. RAF57]|uniref:AfsR/SARP family transcriptional regulator n=1 Tax=Terrabacter sp. RAF57 TaxID=3233063 RepID=UPI003F94CDE3